MLKNIIGLLTGLLFGLGLLISGMTDPVKVQGFLDVFGAWDISLALVMGGGLAVAIVGVQWARRQRKPCRWLPATRFRSGRRSEGWWWAPAATKLRSWAARP